MNLTRRKFLTKTAAGGAAIATIPAIVSSCMSSGSDKSKSGYPFLKKGDVILFQGDSITDAGREREHELPNDAKSLGPGYVFIAAASLLKLLPEKKLTIYNRGRAGKKVFQLAEVWQKDCFDLKPDVISILIGINDYWHTRTGRYNGSPEIYENDYRKLLQRTVDKLPKVKLVLCEPFYVLKVKYVDESWVEPMKKYQQIALQLSKEFDTKWVPYQKIFDEAIKFVSPDYWTIDGVHPTLAGAQLMAEAWLEAIK